MGCILNDVQVRVWMRRIVRDDPNKNKAVRWLKISVHAVCERHQCAIGWNGVREARRKAGGAGRRLSRSGDTRAVRGERC